jgi:D-sedoheptulose 7-phosphate isomerase
MMEHRDVLEAFAAECSEAIERAGLALTACLLAGNKVLTCGNGGSAADAQHFAAEMIGRLEHERPGLPVIAMTADAVLLTALGNDYAFDVVFAKQVTALGASGDLLLVLTTSGNSANVVNVIAAAHDREMRVIALTGKGGGAVRSRLQAGDVEVCVPSARTMRIQEMHAIAMHAMCDLVDYSLLGA